MKQTPGADPAPSRTVDEFYAGQAATYDEQYDPARVLTAGSYPANYFRLEILKRRLAEHKPGRIIDLGLGEGTPAVTLALAAGAEVRGFDYTAEMVEKARANFAAHGLDPARVIQADVQKPASYAALLVDGPFDAALCLGVVPHVEDVPAVLAGIRGCLRPGGRAFVSFRNSVFSLFTMNRYTHAFFLDELLAGAPEALREACSRDLAGRVAMDKPPLRIRTEDGKVGYDAILARFHNPLQAPELFARAGFGGVRLHFYHYHPVPPMLQGAGADPAAFRRAAVDMEVRLAEDWRGHFLCSAYLVEAVAD